MDNTSKQTPQTQRIAKRIRRLHDEYNMTFEKISIELNMLTPSGKPNPGIIKKIGFQGYEPKGRETRTRFGLKDICMTCLRSFRKQKPAARAPAPWLTWWRKLSRAERDRRIRDQYEENR